MDKVLYFMLMLSILSCSGKKENFQIPYDIEEQIYQDEIFYAKKFSYLGDNILISRLLVEKYPYVLEEVIYSKYYVTENSIMLVETLYLIDAGKQLQVNAKIYDEEIQSLTLSIVKEATKWI